MSARPVRWTPVVAPQDLVAPALPGEGPRPPALSDLAAGVRAGLVESAARRLAPSLLYDDLGSTLFEAITLLPEYGLTRADEALLRRHARDIAGLLPGAVTGAELGSGSGRKTRWLLEALGERQRVVRYFPIDISRAALARCRIEMAPLRPVRLEALEADYLDGLRDAVLRRGDAESLLVLFLGSTIGNFERAEAEGFLRDVRRLLDPGDGLLLGVDLLKPLPVMLAAYDDGLGVTAAFDLNLLARINRELGADFDLNRFEHLARWNPTERRVEMHLLSRRAQEVAIRARGTRVRFCVGETIWTEGSHKYEEEEPVALAARAGFECAGRWLDRDWGFAEHLLVAR